MANQGQRATMTKEIAIRIGKRTVEMRLTTWEGGSALTSIVENTRPTATRPSRVFAYTRTGAVVRFQTVGALEDERLSQRSDHDDTSG